MNKLKIIFHKILPVVMILMVVVSTNVFAFNEFTTGNINSSISGGTGLASADKAVKNVWATVSLILQVLAVAAIVFAGVRYMFASADGKADIKKQTIGLVVGAILVFGASFVINFIVTITQEVTNSKVSNAKYTGTTYKQKENRYSNYDNDEYNDWDDVIGPNGIPDIYEQDTNKNGIVDFEDLWLPEHPEDR